MTGHTVTLSNTIKEEVNLYENKIDIFFRRKSSRIWCRRRDTERYEYECPCGKGKIVEEHDNIPGFRDHDVWISCDACSKKYKLDTSRGVRGWELVEKE